MFKTPSLSIEHLHDDLQSSARSELLLSSLSVISAWMGGRLGRRFSSKMGVGVKKLKEKKKTSASARAGVSGYFLLNKNLQIVAEIWTTHA